MNFRFCKELYLIINFILLELILSEMGIFRGLLEEHFTVLLQLWKVRKTLAQHLLLKCNLNTCIIHTVADFISSPF